MLRLLREIVAQILNIYILINIQVACKRFLQLKKI